MDVEGGLALSPSMPLTRNKIRNSEMRDKIVYDHEELYFSDAKSKSRIFELQNSEEQSIMDQVK